MHESNLTVTVLEWRNKRKKKNLTMSIVVEKKTIINSTINGLFLQPNF
jgi:hypothetical protein